MNTRTRRSLLALTMCAAIGLLMVLPAVTLATTPVQNGCPASAELLSVAELESEGPYQVPAKLDDPQNGGNGDGYVCGFALPDAVSTANGADFPIYQFFEDNLPAEK